MDIVLILVFSSVLLVFMIYPSMKIMEYMETKIHISDRMYNFLTIFLTILLSLIVGLLLYYV